MGYTLLKHIFKKVIIKAAFAETGLYPFNLEKVLNKLPLLRKAMPEKNPILIAINIAILKTIRQVGDLA